MLRAPRSHPFVSVGLLALGLAFAPDAARAATLNLVMDDSVFDPGDPITIRLVGDSQGAMDKTLWAAVEVDRAVLLDAHVDTYLPQTNTTLLQGAARGCDFFFSRGTNRCGLMNMVDSNPYPPGFSIDPSTEPFTYAVFTATAGPAGGVHTLNFVSTPTTLRVDFFGLTSAPGVTFTITGDPLPVQDLPPYVPPPTPPVVTQPPPDDTQSPRPPSPIYTTGGGAGGDPIPEPSAALLFAAGLVCVQIKLRTRADTR